MARVRLLGSGKGYLPPSGLQPEEIFVIAGIWVLIWLCVETVCDEVSCIVVFVNTILDPL
jgi:hypothetical protein